MTILQQKKTPMTRPRRPFPPVPATKRVGGVRQTRNRIAYEQSHDYSIPPPRPTAHPQTMTPGDISPSTMDVTQFLRQRTECAMSWQKLGRMFTRPLNTPLEEAAAEGTIVSAAAAAGTEAVTPTVTVTFFRTHAYTQSNSHWHHAFSLTLTLIQKKNTLALTLTLNTAPSRQLPEAPSDFVELVQNSRKVRVSE